MKLNRTNLSPISDAVKGHWVDGFAPTWLRPFARLARWDRPIGWWLLLLPCWWSVAISAQLSGALPDILHLFLFLIGAIAMRGAGCTYNDIIDRKIDAQVERTKMRPLPSGQISLMQAMVFFAVQTLFGFIVLLQFNDFTIYLGFGSLPIIAIYPFMKRVINWPQLVLGFAYSWGALMGYAATFGHLNSFAPFLLYAAAISWTIAYDTIYAHQDLEYDTLIGVRSTARAFGSNSQAMIGFLFILSVIFVIASVIASGGSIFSYLAVAGFAGHFAWQYVRFSAENAERCLQLFRSNRNAGLLLFIGLIIDAII